MPDNVAALGTFRSRLNVEPPESLVSKRHCIYATLLVHCDDVCDETLLSDDVINMSQTSRDDDANMTSGLPPYLATIVLVSGVVGGLLIIITVILFCKYCVQEDSVCVRRR